MKRLISGLLALSCAMSFASAASFATVSANEHTAKTITYGDVNEDFQVDILDISLVRAHIVKNNELSQIQQSIGDINKDTTIDIIDVAMMRNAVVNNIKLDDWTQPTDTEQQSDTDEQTDTTDIITDSESDTATDSATDTDDGITVVEDSAELEFEDGTYRGTLDTTYGHNGKSILFEANSHRATVEFKVANTDTYKVSAYMLSPGGDKVLNLEFNGQGKSSYGISKSSTPVEFVLFTGTLEAGTTYTVKATPNWTYVYADYVKVEKASVSDDSDIEVEYKLSNENASESTKALYAYICEIYGEHVITGQQESTWMDDGNTEYEMEYLEAKTGKLPALRGLDFINDDFDGCVERAKEWYKKGGIVTICWHCDQNFSRGYQQCLNGNLSDWDKALTPGTAEYEKLIAGMDKGAKALKELADEGVPVLWRPFHELDGKWFWWGKGGEQNFIKLWKTMYDRYTNYWGLDNLIWVCGFSQNGLNYANWYPGDEYVDIAGADSYNGGSEPGLYNQVKQVVNGTKPLCFHECGINPTVELFVNQGANWVYFMTWHTSWLTDNSSTALNTLYNSDYAITLDELPDFYGLKSAE